MKRRGGLNAAPAPATVTGVGGANAPSEGGRAGTARFLFAITLFAITNARPRRGVRPDAAAAKTDSANVMSSEDIVAGLVAPPLNAAGYDLVRVRLTGGRPRTLQIMAERRDRTEMTVEDCARISRDLSAILDVEDPVAGPYTLEVSSPGIDRPLVGIGDFERFAGFEARIETRTALDGRRRFRGRLAGVRDGSVLVDVDGTGMAVPHDRIARARLVLTDELVAAGKAAGGVPAGTPDGAETESLR